MQTARTLVSCLLGIAASCGVAHAATYSQNFTFPDGTTVLGDGSDIQSSDLTQGQVIGGQLRMTTDNVNSTWSVYRVPALSHSSLGFTASFNFDLIDAAGDMPPADGFSFVYGDIPATGYGAAEEGMLSDNEISFEADTWMVGDGEHGFNLGLRIAGVEQADPFFSNTDVLADGQSILGGLAVASWNPTNGASLTIDLGGGPVPIFTHVAVPGFVASDTHTFAFSARTGGANETLNLDNLTISTVPEASTVAMSLVGLLCLGAIRRSRG